MLSLTADWIQLDKKKLGKKEHGVIKKNVENRRGEETEDSERRPNKGKTGI